MAKLTISYPVCLPDEQHPGTRLDHRIANETIDPGKVVYDRADGLAGVADAAVVGKQQPSGLSVQVQKQARQSLPIVQEGFIAGYDLTALAFGALVYLDTTGDLADAANATKTVPIGRVVPTTRPNADGTLQKLLYVFFNPLINY
jgi:hypothetical protein